jgi:type IX secretion system PorP/SprF family membrane protein
MVKLFKKILAILLMIISLSVYSQDPQFSQFYASSLYLNPAFTGNTDVGRVSGIYRNQWAAIPGAFVSYSFAYDHNLSNLNSGLGIMVTNDKAGSGGLKYTDIAGLYSYYFQLNRTLFFRTGLKASYTFRGIDKSSLVFADQIIREGAEETVEVFSDDRNSYFDVGTGGLLYSEKFWFGASLDHITKPEQSFLNTDSYLPIKTSFHGGYNFMIEDNIKGDNETSVTAAFNFKNQQKWNQLDIGAYYNKKAFVIGLWYRGIPFIHTGSISNNDAVILLFGFHTKSMKIGYSYDITVSKLAGDTGGSHELSLVYEYSNKKKRRRNRHSVPCAKF